MKKLNPFLLADWYKIVHHKSYPLGLEFMTAYTTPRGTRLIDHKGKPLEYTVVSNIQAFVGKWLIDYFDDNFFYQPWDDIETQYKMYVTPTLGEEHTDMEHIKKLHELGYLPICIKSLPEGTIVPIKTPIIEISNTVSGFAWIVNFIETLMLSEIWQPITNATIGYSLRKLCEEYHLLTCDENSRPIKTLIGDMSMRGMSGVESASKGSLGHLMSFNATATIPCMEYALEYYKANLKTLTTATVSMEHSVMSCYGKDEITAYKRLSGEVFPNGNLSIVSDTYDYENVVETIVPQLKDIAEKRDGKIIIRGDSGNPVEIVVWTIETLLEKVGYTINKKGYKVLNPKWGVIYSDGINIQRLEEIYRKLSAKGISIENFTAGMGAWTYSYNSRDSLMMAQKTTHAVFNGEEIQVFKQPKTDSGKVSQKGLCLVYNDGDGIKYMDKLTIEQKKALEDKDLMVTYFKNSKMNTYEDFDTIRARLHGGKF